MIGLSDVTMYAVSIFAGAGGIVAVAPGACLAGQVLIYVARAVFPRTPK